ncbi:hypothetical protein CVT91_17200 [Candidatus Atribacteria bacterium HGW-Atribacteria-1]|nr:MAG: hypothetical protein CVT91_17200 [Candidatus Atribacteria bacterium HGW-Atribacteria-1]
MYKKGVRLVLTFFVLMSFWLVLSQNLQPASLLIGALFSFLVALLSFDFLIKPDEGMRGRAIRTIWLLLIYVFVLLYEMFLASIDVVYRVITMDINPEVVMIMALSPSISKVIIFTSTGCTHVQPILGMQQS